MAGTPQARLLAKAEYLTEKGHVYHGLAHFHPSDSSDFKEYSNHSRQAFQEATHLLADFRESVHYQNSTAEDQKVADDLLEKLLTQKNIHLCRLDGPHAPTNRPQKNVCKTIYATLRSKRKLADLQLRFNNLLNLIAPVPSPPSSSG